MKLNCDLGESFGLWTMGADAAVMPLIDQANVACGFHASDPLTMLKTVQCAAAAGVEIGAHPGYPDLLGFGRRSLACEPEELAAWVVYQLGALQGICKLAGATGPTYVKPHGAMYHDMMSKPAVFEALLFGLSRAAPGVKLMLQATLDNAKRVEQAKPFGVELIFEAFADREYERSGALRSRQHPDAVIHDVDQILARVERLHRSGELVCHTGEVLQLAPDTLCVHGDNPTALAVVKTLRAYLGEPAEAGR